MNTGPHVVRSYERKDPHMPKLNEHYQDLKESYLFAEIAHRVAAYEAEHPDAKIIRLGIGDVTLPLGDLAIKGHVLNISSICDSCFSKISFSLSAFLC